MLAARFPRTRAMARDSSSSAQKTGIAALDQILGGGLLRHGLTEITAQNKASGSAFVLCKLFEQAAVEGGFTALVDGADSFDPAAIEPRVLERLLWARCSGTTQALKAADLLLRDRNFPLVALDLKMNSPRELRSVSSSIWFRFKRLVEETGATVLVVTPFPLVNGASCRVQLEANLDRDALKTDPSVLVSKFQFSLTRVPGAQAAHQGAKAG